MDEDASLESRAPKRRKRSRVEEETGEIKTARQNKACSNCRRLKVKCDTGWEADGTGNCSRCRRLGLPCLREKKLWTNAEDDAWQTQLTITKLERALEDVLEKLEMPALDLYTSPAIVKPRYAPQPTRPNSEEPLEQPRDVSPDPMNSLIEATQLNGLRSQLRSVKQRRKGGMRRMDHDLISENIISMDEAEELLAVFKKSQSHHLFSASVPENATVESIRASSTVLFTAVMLVAAVHVPGKETLHETCHGVLMGLVASVMFDRFHSLDDIKGLCVAAFWQPYLSWKLSGLSIRMATELNLHHAFYEAFSDPSTTDAQRKDCLEKVRLWYLLYVLDHQSSITFGRPSVTTELRPIKDFELLLHSNYCTSADRALIAQVTNLVVLSRAFAHFGLEPKRTMDGDDATVLSHLRYTDDLNSWKDKWHLNTVYEGQLAGSLSRSVELHHHFSNLVLNSLVLRGRSLDKISELPISLRPLALRAVEAAHLILEHFLYDEKRREEIVGMPLYLFSMIAFAVVFLMKMSPRWHAVGITISPEQRTIPLVEAIVQMLRTRKAGTNHMVFSMATGFERMLRQLRRNNLISAPTRGNWTATEAYNGAAEPYANGNLSGNGYVQTTADMEHLSTPQINQVSPDTNGSQGGQYTNWGFQDDELWSVGMGYDLLEPGSQGLAALDFPFNFANWPQM